MEKGDFPYVLFFGHLTIEKILKALFAGLSDEQPPFTHRLTYLAEKIGLKLSEKQLETLEIISDFNLEARYPDEQFHFYRKCTRDFTQDRLNDIREIREWLLEQIS